MDKYIHFLATLHLLHNLLDFEMLFFNAEDAEILRRGRRENTSLLPLRSLRSSTLRPPRLMDLCSHDIKVPILN